jgi:hypothetical protein
VADEGETGREARVWARGGGRDSREGTGGGAAPRGRVAPPKGEASGLVVALDGLVVAAVARWGDQLAKPAGEGFRAPPSPKGTTLLTGGGGDSSTAAAAAAAGVVVGKGAPVGRRQAAAPACALLLLLLGLAPALPAGLCGWVGGVFG